MKSAPRLGRRPLLAGALGGALLAAPSRTERTPLAALLAFSAGLDCPKTIGAACLAALPGREATQRTLARALLRQLPASGKTLSSAVREQSRRDFANGKTVFVRGWVLSETETRLYALATLLRVDKLA